MRFSRVAGFLSVLFAFGLALPGGSAASSYTDEIQAAGQMALENERADVRLSKHSIEIWGMPLAIHGSAARKHVRFACWALHLDGDRRAIFLEKGMPTFRHRENDQDRVTEHWTYLCDDVTYIFSGDRLLKKQPY
jgi:hypothetical protein